MTTFKLIAKSNGISTKTGKPWFMVTLRATDNGRSVVNNFFISEKTWNAMQREGVAEDDIVLVTATLEANLRFAIDIIEKAEVN